MHPHRKPADSTEVFPSEFLRESPTLAALDSPRIEYGAISDRGLHRETNEDNYSIVRRTRRREVLCSSVQPRAGELQDDHAYVLVVADGMGGTNCGELASELVLRFGWELAGGQSSWLMRAEPEMWPRVKEGLHRFGEQIQQKLLEHSAQHPETNGMGTTWTCMYTLGWAAILAHVGDSRAYLFRQGELRRLTTDHTLAEQLLRIGHPAEDAVRYRSVLTNAFGCGNESVSIESDHLLLEPGDRLMLCSDGLYDMVSDAAIATALAEQPNPQAAAELLRDLALAGGGRDNVTVLVVDFHNP